MNLPIIFNDRYQLVKKIGEGGLAEVYKAQDLALDRAVAVKVLRPEFAGDPSFLVNFHREAQNAARLSDPFIVAVYDFGQHQEHPYIVMEWIAGSDLRSRINDLRLIPFDQAVSFTIQICGAVGTAHRAGIVHGDLKPGNILITPNQQAKVTDFGLARALGQSAMDEGEVVWGTPTYFAPEQASGSQVLPATDVYAIGIILYEMLTGRVPFVGVDDQDVARKQLYEAHIPVDRLNATIPEPLARIVDAAMAKNPNERFLTADHLREALTLYQQGRLGQQQSHREAPISAVVGSPLQQQGQQYRRRQSPPPPPPPPPAQNYTPASQASGRKGGVDIVMLVLALLAIVAVIGVILLGVAIFQYASEASLDGPNAPLAIASGQVRAPDLVGLTQSNAEATMETFGLELVIDGEEPHPTWPAGTIIRQQIEPGSGIATGESITVVVSEGPLLVEMPDVTGQPFEVVQQELEALDLVAQQYKDWSAEPIGQILLQDPPPGSLIANRTLVTLVVSNGSRIPVGANLGGQIGVEAYDIPRLQFKAGENVSLTFFWQALTPPAEDYHLFIHLTTLQGGIVAQIDGPPQSTGQTSRWPAGEIVVDPYQLQIPASTAPGDYQLRIGFYNPDSKARVRILEAGRGEQDNLGALILRSIQVTQ